MAIPKGREITEEDILKLRKKWTKFLDSISDTCVTRESSYKELRSRRRDWVNEIHRKTGIRKEDIERHYVS